MKQRNRQEARSFRSYISLLCIRTLLMTMSSDVKHLLLLADGVHKLYGLDPMGVAPLLEVVRACAKSAGAKLTTVTVTNARSIRFNLRSEEVGELTPFVNLMESVERLRWENVSFRIVVERGLQTGPETAVKSGQMDLTSSVDVRTALLDLLDCNCPADRASRRVRNGKWTLNRFSADSGRYIKAWEVLKSVYNMQKDSNMNCMTMRPVNLGYLFWASKNDY